jgi:hypothetical protein
VFTLAETVATPSLPGIPQVKAKTALFIKEPSNKQNRMMRIFVMRNLTQKMHQNETKCILK